MNLNLNVSQRKRPSLGLCLESLLGQSGCVEGVETGCVEGSLCSGGDVMNRSGDSCVYQWLCSGWKCGCGVSLRDAAAAHKL